MLEPDEIFFLRFHLTEPLPEAWQFVPQGEGEATFQAVKVLEDGRVVMAKLPISSFSRIEAYFDDDYRVTEEGRVMAGGELAI